MVRAVWPVVLCIAATAWGYPTAVQAGTIIFDITDEIIGPGSVGFDVVVAYGSIPSCGVIKLAGQSGPDGGDESSGLFREICVILSPNPGIVRYESFGGPAIDTSYWTLFGVPEAHIVESFGQSCLMASGDSLGLSGVYSQESYDWSSGFSSHFWVRVGSEADFHSLEFGIADVSDPAQLLLGMRWHNNNEGENVLQFVTDISCVEVPAPPVGRWYHVEQSADVFTTTGSSSWSRIKAMSR
jgi:hypothetical protein